MQILLLKSLPNWPSTSDRAKCMDNYSKIFKYMIHRFPLKCCYFFSLRARNKFFKSKWGSFSKENQWEAHCTTNATPKGPVRHLNFHCYTSFLTPSLNADLDKYVCSCTFFHDQIEIITLWGCQYRNYQMVDGTQHFYLKR